MSDNKDKRDDEKKNRPPRTGHTIPGDPALVEFLERLWTRGNPPERLEVWRVAGSKHDVRRALIFYENFRHDDPYDIERCVKLSGEIYAAAQNDCDGAEQRSFYELAILDAHQPQALLRRIGPLSPQRVYAGVDPDGEPRGGRDVDDEDPGIPGLKPTTHIYLEKIVSAIDRTLQQVHAVVGDTLQLQQGIVVSQQAHNERLQNQVLQVNDQLQNERDRSLDRELVREREKVKLSLWQDGAKVGKNLIIGLFPDGESAGSAAGGQQQLQKSHGMTKERQLVDSLLDECKEQNVAVALFGDWDTSRELSLMEIFAGIGLKKPGIFHPAQFGALLGVREGQLPPDALDPVLPGSGAPQAITPEQMLAAQPLLTQAMFIAIQQLQALRDAKRAEAA